MVPTHTYTHSEKEFFIDCSEKIFFSFIEFFSLLRSFFRENFPLFRKHKKNVTFWLLCFTPSLNFRSQNLIQICVLLSTHFRGDSPARWEFFSLLLFFFSMTKGKFTLSFEQPKARLQRLFITFSVVFSVLLTFMNKFSAKFSHFSTFSLHFEVPFFLVDENFSPHIKIFFFTPNFDRKVARKQFFLTVNRLNWLLVIV